MVNEKKVFISLRVRVIESRRETEGEVWRVAGGGVLGIEGRKANLLVNDVLDVVMHALVGPPFVWLHVKCHLCEYSEMLGYLTCTL